MRDFLYSEIANYQGMSNVPDDPELAIHVGKQLCETLLEPLQRSFGRIAIRSGYRSPAVNEFGNLKRLNCASNEKITRAISGIAATKTAAPGRWHGGFTIIFPTAPCTFFRNWRLLILGGTNDRSGASTVISSPRAALRAPAWRTITATTQVGTRPFQT